MAYLHASAGEPVPPEQISSLGRLLGLEIPADDLTQLSTALRDQLASVDRLSALDLSDVVPTAAFDPRWDD